MANVSFLPVREPELVTWIQNFDSRINLSPLVFGLSALQASAFSDLASAFIAAYTLCNSDATNSRSATQTKNTAKAAVIASARQLAGIVQKFPGTTDTMRSDLGLNIAASRTPINPPTYAPELAVVSVSGRRADITLRAPGSSRRGMPVGTHGALVMSYTAQGTNPPPSDPSLWKMEGITTRSQVPVEFPPTLAPGTQVYLAAAYLSPRGVAGPLCQPVSLYIAGGLGMPGMTELKIAA